MAHTVLLESRQQTNKTLCVLGRKEGREPYFVSYWSQPSKYLSRCRSTSSLTCGRGSISENDNKGRDERANRWMKNQPHTRKERLNSTTSFIFVDGPGTL